MGKSLKYGFRITHIDNIPYIEKGYYFQQNTLMIHYTKGNLLDSDARALVNTVNTVGVMGKGIALQFREAFPENYRFYRKACLKKSLVVGQLLVFEDSNLTSGH